MNYLRTGVAIVALLATAPVQAQLGGALGGGLGGSLGGLGGGLGGGVGGSLGGGVGGSLGGTLGGTIERAPVRDRAIPRTPRVPRTVTTEGAIAASGDSRIVRGELTGSTAAEITRPALRTRGTVSATQRGLNRVTATARGVPVFVRGQVPTRIAVAPYPVYRPGTYYGGPDTVVLTQVEVGGYMDRQQRDLERAVRGSGSRVIRRGDDLIVQLPADVTFAFDKADIQPRFYGTLSAVARSLDEYPGTDVQVVGHTDSVGSDTYNLGLSERRGRNVADFLATRSVEPQRMVVEAAGEAEPVASNATISGRAANRRVEIVLHPRAG